jgi:GrpB-like predicted nucleotidyltransferase (UPF0157 family)
MSTMPNELDEAVHISQYQPRWLTLLANEQQRLSSALGLVGDDVQHIGSTAVPGLAAKPIVDIMIGLVEFPPTAHKVQQLVELGYEFLGEVGVPARLYLRQRGDSAFNLHLVSKGGRHWTNNIDLRELLRGSARARERYNQAKAAALADGATTLLAYSAAKSLEIEKLLSEALSVQRGS